ncbi:hypothetical protein AAGT00_31125 [Streptomyces cavourensis]
MFGAALLTAAMAGLAAAAAGTGAGAPPSAAADLPAARNVILLVGDGMGDSEITLARTTRWARVAGYAWTGSR